MSKLMQTGKHRLVICVLVAVAYAMWAHVPGWAQMADGSAESEPGVAKPSVEGIFAARLAKATGDADACVKLAQWAQGQHLDKEYVWALRMALLADRKSPQARRLLQEYRRNHAYLERNDKAGQKMLADMGDEFRLLRTDRYRICYNSADIFADISAERLKTIYDEFMIFFEHRYFEPTPLTDRLEVVLFDSPRDYRGFANRFAPGMGESAGFYSNKTDRSYFYDSISENNDSYRQNRETLMQQRETVANWRKEVTAQRDSDVRFVVTAEDGTKKDLTRAQFLSHLKEQESELETEFAKLRDFYLNQNITVTMHELTHQLAHSCGIHSKYYDNPKWIIEGLAMYFETGEDGKWTEPGLLNHDRLKMFVKSDRTQQRVSLTDLIIDDDVFHLNGLRASHAYAAAWTLFYYLDHELGEQLYDYMYDLSMRISDEAYDAAARLEDFEKYFGRFDLVEEDWRRFAADLAK